MTKSELRVKVAEACGWTYCRPADCKIGQFTGIPSREVESGYGRLRTWIPDYPKDLNACAEFEKTLSYHEANYYTQVALPELTKGKLVLAQVFATAEQRCLAFLKVKGIL